MEALVKEFPGLDGLRKTYGRFYKKLELVGI